MPPKLTSNVYKFFQFRSSSKIRFHPASALTVLRFRYAKSAHASARKMNYLQFTERSKVFTGPLSNSFSQTEKPIPKKEQVT